VNKIIIFLLVFLTLVLSACGQTVSPPEVVEPTQAPTQTAVEVVEPTPEPTQTPEVTLEPTPTPTAEPEPAESDALSELDLEGTTLIGELLKPDETSLKVFTEHDIAQFARELYAGGIFLDLLDEGPFTVFAPVYQFEDLPVYTPDKFKEALESHIVRGSYTEEELIAMDGQNIPTLAEGVIIQITVNDGVVYLNDVAMLIQADIAASNGVIHVIDKFLLTPAD